MARTSPIEQQISRLSLPAAWVSVIRGLVDRIQVADTAMDCLLAQERAEGVVQGLELAQAQPTSTTERLYILIEDAAKRRLGDLGSSPPPGP